jgi:hypothetical protein
MKGFHLPNQLKVAGNLSLNEKRNIGAAGFQTDFIAFVDDDNDVSENALDYMADFARANYADAVSPKILDSDGKLWFSGAKFDFMGRFVKTDDGTTDTFHDVFMVRKKAFDYAKGFDTKNFPFYLGEADLAERMSSERYYVCDAIVRHKIGAGRLRGSHIRDERRAYYVARNQLLFVRRHRDVVFYLLFWFPFRTAAHLLAMVRERKWSFVRAYLRGIHDGLR